MMKKIMKAIRERLLKIDWIEREVARYKFDREKQQGRERFAHLMHIGNTVHTEDKPLLVNYVDGRMLGQRPVTPLFIDSTNWGIEGGDGPCEVEGRGE